MTSDDLLDQYLWDPAADAAPDVMALEERLAPARFEPAVAPLDLSRLPARGLALRRWGRPVAALAIAASLLVAAGYGLWMWRLTWPDGRPWSVTAGGADFDFTVGQPLIVPSSGGAVANIARIGSMRIDGGSAIELRSTRGLRHRLRMTAGDVHVRVWAPPFSVVIETPAGEVIDMGCEFRLSVDGERSAVQVLSGWVQLENGIGQVLVPAGASSAMTSTDTPGVPVFDDAGEPFRNGVRAIESGAEADGLPVVLALARPRDVYTLLLLTDRRRHVAEPLLRRAAELSPPPDNVTIGGILRGNRQQLWTWAHAQPLPSPKKDWWKNWRDALPLR